MQGSTRWHALIHLCIFYALIASTSNNPIRLAEHQRVALTRSSAVEIMYIKDGSYSPYLPPRAPVKSANLMYS